MWSLILVFTFTTYHGTGMSTTVIPNFSSYETCAAAGSQVDNIKRFICIEVK